jgi:hypothetical protein
MKFLKFAVGTGLVLGIVIVISFLISVFIVGISYKYITFSNKDQIKDTWVLDEHSMIINTCPSLKKQLKEVGVIGEHPLVLREGNFNDSRGVPSKSYFLNTSSGTEGFSDFGEVQFRWRLGLGEGKIATTTLQSLQIRFFVDETKEVPTIEFVFDKKWINKACNDIDINKDSHFKNSHLNENRYVMSDVMMFAKIRISREEADKQIYFIMEKLIEQELNEKELF